MLARRAFSQCSMVRKSRSLRSVISALSRDLKSRRHPSEVAWPPRSPVHVRAQTWWPAWSTGELKIPILSPTNNASSLAGLVNRGVDIVVGSHPHCVQLLDFYHGCPIAYSLGNLVFDGAPTIASWNHSALLKVTLDDNGKVSSISSVPLVIEDGLPRVDMASVNSDLNFASSRAVAP